MGGEPRALSLAGGLRVCCLGLRVQLEDMAPRQPPQAGSQLGFWEEPTVQLRSLTLTLPAAARNSGVCSEQLLGYDSCQSWVA